MKRQTWIVIRTTHRHDMVYVELGNRPAGGGGGTYGPTFSCPLEGSPRVGDEVVLTMEWGVE